MALERYDVVVLGGGPAGYPAAIRAAQLGGSVCLVEKDRLGGVCLNWGCIPTKTLHGTAHLVETASSADGTGTRGRLEVDPADLLAHKNRVVKGLVSGVARLLERRGIEVVRGEGRITGPGEIDVEGHGKVAGKSLIVATGSSEMALPGMEFDHQRILGSTDLLDLGRIPESMIIIGGGVIGCEFASIFNAFGTKVSIVEMLPTIVATEDAGVVRFLQTLMKKRGISLHLGTRVASLKRSDGGVTASLEDGSPLTAELALVSVGRRPNITDIGLEKAGVETKNGAIRAGEDMRTSAEGVFAAGDVTGGWLLAHVATREGVTAAENALGGDERVDYSAVPSTIYTLPEVSRVGMTEKEAAGRGLETSTGRFPFAASGKAKGLREEEGFVKWVAEKGSGKLLGLHVIGPQATELLPAGIIAVGSGMTASDMARFMFPHPTLSEAIGEAAEAVEGRAINIL